MRNIKNRLTWYRTRLPSGGGMCAQHVMLALDTPRQGLPDATAMYRAVPKSKMRTGPAPRGAIVYWTGGANGHGHVCFALGNGTELSVDVNGVKALPGVKPFPWFAKNWGNLNYKGWSWYWGSVDTEPEEKEEPKMGTPAFRDYTGKVATAEEFPIDGKWHDIPGLRDLKGSPFRNSDEYHTGYVRMYPEWPNAVAADLTVAWRWVRANGDATGHDDEQYSPGSKSIPVRMFHDEVGTKDIGGKWQLKMEGGPKKVVLKTRYAKLRALDVDWV